jgi:hypothetical protein
MAALLLERARMIDLATLRNISPERIRALGPSWPCLDNRCAICNAVSADFMAGAALAEASGAPDKKTRMGARLGYRQRRAFLAGAAILSQTDLSDAARRIMHAAHDAGRAL